MDRRLVALLPLLCCLLAGCTYVCHTYDRFVETLEPQGWSVSGKIRRFHHEDWESGPGSWPHWSARDDDRYRLELVPIAADTTYWARGDVEIKGVTVTAGETWRRVDWVEVVDQPAAAAGRTDYWGRCRYHELKYGKDRFVSEFFSIETPVPDTLWVDYELVLKDRGSSVPSARWKLRSAAVIDRHRRWHIIDMIES